MVAEPISETTTFLFVGLVCAMILALALRERLGATKSVITGAFAVGSVVLGHAFDIFQAPEDALLPTYISMVDWSVIVIILGSGLFVDVIARSGIFTWSAIRLTKLSGGDPVRLLWFYGAITVIFSAVLNNVTAMLIVASATTVSLKKLERKDLLLGFLLTEAVLSNVGGLLTLISSIPNVIFGTAGGIDFLSFFLKAAPFVVVATIASIFLARAAFGIGTFANSVERERAAELLEAFDEKASVSGASLFGSAWLLLLLFILGIATASLVSGGSDLGVGFVAMTFAVVALVWLERQPEKAYAAIDWDLVFFLIYLFVVVGVMEQAAVLNLIGRGLERLVALGPAAGPVSLLWSSAVVSSLTDNVPLSAALAKILGSTSALAEPRQWWAAIFGCNLGGSLTPIGSASTLVAVSIIHRHEGRVGFFDLVLKLLPFALLQLAVASAYVIVS